MRHGSGDSVAWARAILHADMDAFYAAVEVLDHPEWRGQPLIVGFPGARSVVSTASYEARTFGVRSAMPMAEAMRRCPQAIVAPPRMSRYVEVSQRLRAAMFEFTPLVEPLSLDEAFLDLSGSQRLHGPAPVIARKVQEAIERATDGLTVSVGLAPCKFVAKVASDLEKPHGCVIVPPERVLEVLAPLPVSRLWGVGVKTEPRMHALGLTTIGDVAAADPAWLERELGELGRHVSELARGIDARDVIPERAAVSIGSETTLAEDVQGALAIQPHLLAAAEVVAARLRAEGLMARGVTVKLKTRDFKLVTRQLMRGDPTDHTDEIYETASELLQRFDLALEYRLVGIAVSHLTSGPAVQGALWQDPERERRRRLDRTVDRLRARFGDSAVHRATFIDPPLDPDDPE